MTFTPRSRASWIVAMFSASSLSPYQLPAPIPMHPRAMGNTEGPLLPSCSFFVVVTSRTLPSGFEVAPALEIGDESGIAWAPPQPLSRVRARGLDVEREEARVRRRSGDRAHRLPCRHGPARGDRLRR